MRLHLIIEILIVVCFATSCANEQQVSAVPESLNKPANTTKATEFSETQAVEFAEKFIRQNGYTDLQPDKEHLALESIEWESDVVKVLKMRHDSLEQKAFGISPHRKSGSPGWTVVFRYKHRSDSQTRKNGRAVTMNLDGSDARVEHVDFILARVDKKL